MQDTTHHSIILGFFLSLFIASIFLLGWLIWPFISTIIIALVVAGMFAPIYRFFLKKMRPWLASLLTCIMIFMVLFIPIILFMGILAKEANGLFLMGKNAVLGDQLEHLLESNRILERANLVLANFKIRLTGEELNIALSELARVVGLWLTQQAALIAQNTLKFLVNFFFMLLIAFFLLMDGERLVSFIVDLSPLPDEQDIKLIQKFKEMAGAILIGNGLCGLIQGVLGGAAFAVFGLPSPLLWGVIMALLAFLPILGIGLVLLPTAAILFLKGQFAVGIFFVVFYAVLSLGIEYLYKPRLVGKRVKMHTLLVFLSIIGGLNLFGILGIIYGPLVVTAFLTLTDIYYTSYRRWVDPDTDTDYLRDG